MVIVLTAWKQNIRMGESQRLNAFQILLVIERQNDKVCFFWFQLN